MGGVWRPEKSLRKEEGVALRFAGPLIGTTQLGPGAKDASSPWRSEWEGPSCLYVYLGTMVLYPDGVVRRWGGQGGMRSESTERMKPLFA